jgi:ribonuclease-3
LQETLQAEGRPQPAYVLVQSQGPEHKKVFTVEARLRASDAEGASEFVGRAEGSTKKTAEQDAARQVLEYLAALPSGGDGAEPGKRRAGGKS